MKPSSKRDKKETLERCNRLLAKSTLTEADALRFGNIIKRRAWAKHTNK